MKRGLGLVPLRAWRCLVLRSSAQAPLLRVLCFLECYRLDARRELGLLHLRAWRCLVVLRFLIQALPFQVLCSIECCQVEDRLGLVLYPYGPGVVWC